MTRIPIRHTGLVLLSLLLLPLSPLTAQVKDLREMLRDALYTEEVTRDPEAAAKQYEALLSEHDTQRAFAASALFRLAEVRRKQDRKDEAIALYQKLLDRFPEAEVEAKLAAENLAALGAKPAEAKAPARDFEQEEIERLRKLSSTSPDLLRDALVNAVHSQQVKVVEFLISQGADAKTSDALRAAVEKGNLEICKILLKQGKPSPEVAGNALAQAARLGRMSILNFLLEAGLDADSPVPGITEVRMTPLFVAVEVLDLKAAAALLDHGADIDFMIPSGGDPEQFPYVGTPLHLSVKDPRGLPMFRLLLERGAKPDLPTPNAGVTPLHMAAWAGQSDALEMVKELLAKGADPNRRSTLSPAGENQAQKTYAMVTPFELALKNNVPNAGARVDAMLAKGANLNLHNREGRTLLSLAVQNKDTQRIETLLRWKADPNVADKNGATPLTLATSNGDKDTIRKLLEAGADPNKANGKVTPLSLAFSTKNDGWPIVELLLAKGAKPEAAIFRKALDMGKWDLAMKMLDAGAPLPEAATEYPWASSLVVAMKSADALPLMERMIAMGAKPDDSWIRAGFTTAYYRTALEIARPVRSFLFRRFILPTLEVSPGVRVVIHGVNGTVTTVVDEPAPPLGLRPLALSLLEPANPLPSGYRIFAKDRLTVWRKSGENWTAADEIPLGGNEDLPILQRGDVIEITDGPEPGLHREDQSTKGIFAPDLQWSLRKRVSFPVTVEIDGKEQEVTLRGDRMIFDPGRPGIVPLAGARQVLQYLWQPEIDVTETYSEPGRLITESMEVIIKRDGWPDVRLRYRDSQKDFPLRAGDRILFESPKVPESRLADLRKGRIVVKTANGPFARQFGELNGNNTLVAATIPTLLQAVAEVTQLSAMKDAPDDPVALRAWLLERSSWQFAYVQRPDLSKIRIRRLQEDGTEKILDIDLANTIAETPEDASSEDVRKADVELQGGDIVEITSLPADDAKPWSGPSPREGSFFAKALSCRIQVTDSAGDIRVQEIRFRAPRMVSIDDVLIPLPAPEAVSSLTAWAVLNTSTYLMVSRNQQPGSSLAATEIFLREGDRVIMPAVAQPRSRAVIPAPSPR